MTAQHIVNVVNEGSYGKCIERNAFQNKSDYDEYFSYRGKSSLHRLNYNEDNIINSEESFIEYLDMGDDYTFLPQSRVFYNEQEIVRYKQLFQGVEVEPGGFAFISGDPCNTTINPFIYGDLDDVKRPAIDKDDLKDILEVDFIKADLVLSANAKNECSLREMWRVSYQKEELKIAWVDAFDGTVVHSRNYADASLAVMSKETYNNTEIQKSGSNFISESASNLDLLTGSVTFYEQNDCDVTALPLGSTVMSITNDPNLIVNATCAFDNDNLTTLSTNFNTVNSCLTFLGISTPPAIVITGCTPQSPASAVPLNNDPNGIVFHFGTQDIPDESIYLPHYSTDVIAHEYGHHFLNQFFFSATSIHHRVIHEYFADLFSLHVNTNGCGASNDFELSFLDGGAIRDFTEFDFNDPCRYEVDESTFDSNNPHFYGAPFRYLAYQIIDNGLLTLSQFFSLSVGILSTFPDDGSVTDLAHLYIDGIISQFGACSDEAELVTDLAESLCLTEQLFPCDVIEITYTTPTTQVTVEGVNLSVCENEHNGTISLSINSDNFDPDVVHRWSGLRPDWIINGEENNTNVTGEEIVIQFPKYDWYPRKYTICNFVRSQGREGCLSIVLRDCDDNDPTCHEVFAEHGNLDDSTIDIRSHQMPNESSNHFEAYDVVGRLIMTGDLEQVRNKLSLQPKQTFIIMEYDKNRSYLQTYKFIIQ